MTAAVPLVERLAEVRAGLWNVLSDLTAAHPMWIGDDGKPLDYLPEREAHIAAFVQDATEALLPVVEQAVAEALRSAAAAGPATTATDQLWRMWLRDRADAIATTEGA